MLVNSKKVFLLSSVWQRAKCTWALISKKSLLIYFESYQGIPYSHTGRVGRGMRTLCQLLTLTLYARDSLEEQIYVV